VNVDELSLEEMSATEYLTFKERLVLGGPNGDHATIDQLMEPYAVLELDFEPFNRAFPRMNRLTFASPVVAEFGEAWCH
jgi:sucrose synthase